ncbi:EAL domain-containing protein [Synechococcus sp. GreenBA-s]|nr:EAL domain-containing protein [Synechococcus sp. GreenBA-s]
METSWSLHLLSEILSAFSTDDPDNLRNAVNRVTEAVDAEVGAIFDRDGITCCIGLSPREGARLVELADARPAEVQIRSGTLHTCWATIGKEQLVVGRLGDPFDVEERSLLRAMARSIELSIGLLRAISAERHARDEAHHDATHDALTGLPNRRLVLEGLNQALAREPQGQMQQVVLFIDIDRFKIVNDAHGHAAGDQLLINVARMLRESVRESDLVGRLSGDEFIVISQTATVGAATDLAQRIIEAIRRPIVVAGTELSHSASIGIAFGETGQEAHALLENADIAMYQAKSRGRGHWAIFQESMRAEARERLYLEGELRHAIENGEIESFYQPIYRLSDRSLVGFEALARWRHRQLGLLPPSAFIPQAEASEVIVHIDLEVLNQAAGAMARWQRIDGLADLRLSSNLSARTLNEARLQQRIAGILDSSELAPGSLYLEITETMLVDDIQSTTATINGLRDLGVRLAIDDFGTGYSSLLYLKRFPVGVLKIDHSFVDGLVTNPEDEMIAGAIISLAKALGLEVVAEGVETEDQRRIVARLGSDFGQGYLFGRPQGQKETLRLIEDYASSRRHHSHA